MSMSKPENSDSITKVQEQLIKIETEIADLKARWPAHSLKPAMVFELEDLEEERDRLKALLEGLS